MTNDWEYDENYRAWRAGNLDSAGVLHTVGDRDIYRAITDCIVKSAFGQDDWVRLADDLGPPEAEMIDNHPRLLRSLHWGDDDYPGHVRTVVEKVLGGAQEGLDVFVQHLNLEEWLRSNDPDRANRLFGEAGTDSHAVLSSEQLTTSGVRLLVRRLQAAEPDRPDELIGKSKNLLESTAKCVLHQLHAEVPANPKLPELLSQAFAALGLDPSSPPGPEESRGAARQLVQGLRTSASAFAELRNRVGDGHGQLHAVDPDELRGLAELSRDSALAIATVLINALQRARLTREP